MADKTSAIAPAVLLGVLAALTVGFLAITYLSR
jgi:hypothetical protein